MAWLLLRGRKTGLASYRIRAELDKYLDRSNHLRCVILY
jgi:hypothetical protein